MGLQDALSGQPPAFWEGVHTRTQLVGVEEPDISKMHWGWAVVPAGTSVGQGEEVLQAGEQKSPAMPVI